MIEGVTTVLRDADTIMCRDLYFVRPRRCPGPGAPPDTRSRRHGDGSYVRRISTTPHSA